MRNYGEMIQVIGVYISAYEIYIIVQTCKK